MEEKEREFIKKIYIDKAYKKTGFTMTVLAISLATYVLPLIFGEFDFGLIFEVLSLFFLIIARRNMDLYDEVRSKRFTVLAMIPVGWLLIYDFIIYCTYITSILYFIPIFFEFFYAEILSIIYITMLVAINRDLEKADNPEKYKSKTDWFYEKYEDNKG